MKALYSVLEGVLNVDVNINNANAMVENIEKVKKLVTKYFFENDKLKYSSSSSVVRPGYKGQPCQSCLFVPAQKLNDELDIYGFTKIITDEFTKELRRLKKPKITVTNIYTGSIKTVRIQFLDWEKDKSSSTLHPLPQIQIHSYISSPTGRVELVMDQPFIEEKYKKQQ